LPNSKDATLVRDNCFKFLLSFAIHSSTELRRFPHNFLCNSLAVSRAQSLCSADETTLTSHFKQRKIYSHLGKLTVTKTWRWRLGGGSGHISPIRCHGSNTSESVAPGSVAISSLLISSCTLSCETKGSQVVGFHVFMEPPMWHTSTFLRIKYRASIP